MKRWWKGYWNIIFFFFFSVRSHRSVYLFSVCMLFICLPVAASPFSCLDTGKPTFRTARCCKINDTFTSLKFIFHTAPPATPTYLCVRKNRPGRESKAKSQGGTKVSAKPARAGLAVRTSGEEVPSGGSGRLSARKRTKGRCCLSSHPRTWDMRWHVCLLSPSWPPTPPPPRSPLWGCGPVAQSNGGQLRRSSPDTKSACASISLPLLASFLFPPLFKGSFHSLRFSAQSIASGNADGNVEILKTKIVSLTK